VRVYEARYQYFQFAICIFCALRQREKKYTDYCF
jgi:hypothetical protein